MYWNRKLFHLNQALKTAHSELASKNAVLETLSVTDELTGLFNRMKLDRSLRHEMERALRYKTPFSVILMDIDHFKNINDTLGHQGGDMVLQRIAATLRDNVREVDIVGRWGGEEFLVICPNTELRGAALAAENLRFKIGKMSVGNAPSPTACFGVAEYVAGDDEASLLHKADRALYRAKDNGRNRVESGEV
jgi:diguanylate cyclase (GGDEF)-like protein